MLKKRMISCILAAAMLTGLAACSSAAGESESPAATEGAIVAMVNDVPILLEDVQSQFDSYSIYYTESDLESLRDDLIDNAVNETVVKIRLEQEGLYPLTDEGEAQVEADYEEVLSTWRTQLESILLEEDDYADATEEELAAEVEAQLQAYMNDMGYTEEYIKELLSYNYAANQLYEKYTEDVTVTDDEVRAEYDRLVEEDKTSFEESPMEFEYADTYYYAPEGYKRIKHIFKSLTDEQEDEIQALRDEGNEEEADALEQQYMDALRQEMEALLPTLTAENFDEVMQEETMDPGLSYYPDGYVVSPDVNSTSYDQTFTETAGTLENVGDISGVIESSMGYHILMYAEAIPSGAVDYDSVKDSVQEDLLETRKNEVYSGLVQQWRSEMTVETYPELVDMGDEETEEASQTAGASAEASPTAETSAEASPSAEAS